MAGRTRRTESKTYYVNTPNTSGRCEAGVSSGPHAGRINPVFGYKRVALIVRLYKKDLPKEVFALYAL
jgi:hypothetical protein